MPPQSPKPLADPYASYKTPKKGGTDVSSGIASLAGRPTLPGPTQPAASNVATGVTKIYDQTAPSAMNQNRRAPGQKQVYNPETGQLEWVEGYSPIGVQDEYVAQVPVPGAGVASPGGLGGVSMWPGGAPGRGVTAPVTPRYTTGDEVTALVGMPTETIVNIQEMMVDMGLIPTGTNVAWGMNDSATRAAMAEVMAIANANGTDWSTALNTSYQNVMAYTAGGYLDETGQPIEGGGAGKLPPSGYLTNTQDLRAMVQQVAQNTIGRKVDESFIEQFVNNFHAMESAFNSAVQAGQSVPKQLPTAAIAAENAIVGDYGNEAEAMSLSATFDQFRNIIRGPFQGA